jgi:hypothetical protein
MLFLHKEIDGVICIPHPLHLGEFVQETWVWDRKLDLAIDYDEDKGELPASHC